MVESSWERRAAANAAGRHRANRKKQGSAELRAKHHRREDSDVLNASSLQDLRSCTSAMTTPVLPLDGRTHNRQPHHKDNVVSARAIRDSDDAGPPVRSIKRNSYESDGWDDRANYFADLSSCYQWLPTENDAPKLVNLFHIDSQMFDLFESTATYEVQLESSEYLHWVMPTFANDLPENPLMWSTEPPPFGDVSEIQLPPYYCSKTTTNTCHDEGPVSPLAETCLSRARTSYTHLHDNYEDSKEQRRMGRIVGNLRQMEHQQKGYVKQQLRVTEDSENWQN